jgi:hypothetical protein
MQDNPNTERRPPPEGKTRIEEERSASQAALHALELVETGAGVTLGGLLVADAYAKAKDALGSNGDDSNSSSESKD